ncbi:MAG: 16S rRNA (cytosine(1402)-N(4))-methyltransferase RsmH [Chloroflexi bacterium]|nr:16S rRNA (cytosine(1402)-N(4))-methyltransferase RsmH [Chloroflexota bacterium]
MTTHTPVLPGEVLDALQPRPAGVYIDGTLGAGGHSQLILHAAGSGSRLLGLDADPDALARAAERLASFGERAVLVNSNFANLGEMAQEYSFIPCDGILLDLGLSSMQLTDGERGFSFQQDGPLDMRFDPTQPETAADLLNNLPEQELANLIYTYGEEHQSRRIARAIVQARPLRTTRQLADLIARVTGRGRQGIHPATRTFQALRIAVNEELQVLEQVLPQALHCLKPGGRLAVISFHSLEDRIVKNFFQQEARDCICPPEQPICTCDHHSTLTIVTRRPIQPTDEEVNRNPRSRSAKLRVAERLPDYLETNLG